MALPPTYVNFQTPAIDAGNLNDLNIVNYTLLGNGVQSPVTRSEIRTNLGLGSAALVNVPLTVTNGGVSNAPVFSAFRNASQALADATLTEVAMNQTEFDTLGTFNTTNGKYTPTVAGYYQISCSISVIVAGGFSTNFQVSIFKNGATYKRGDLINTNSLDNATLGGGVSTLIFLNGTTDSVSVGIFSDISAGTQTIGGEVGGTSSWISGHFVRS